jgi:hypothetical protein
MKSTPFYHLPLYEDADAQDLRDGYNNAMILMDQKLHQIDNIIQDMKNGVK